MLGTSKENKKDLILKMEREQSERLKENQYTVMVGPKAKKKGFRDLNITNKFF